MGSGDGKSVTARNAACQLAHHGALIVVLDTKMMSQHWAAGLPNVAYARTPAEMHELAIWLAGEVDRRNKVALYSADVEGKVHANVGPRIVGILEELNITQSVLSAYWKSIGGKGRSPAVVALDVVSYTGRQVNVNLIYIGQRLSAKAVSGGSGDARENLGVLLMSNPAASHVEDARRRPSRSATGDGCAGPVAGRHRQGRHRGPGRVCDGRAGPRVRHVGDRGGAPRRHAVCRRPRAGRHTGTRGAGCPRHERDQRKRP